MNTVAQPVSKPMLHTNDMQIRSALHRKLLSSYQCIKGAKIVDELGLAHAKVRIDVAVITDSIHGFEIKSSLDTLERLPAQLQLYRKCLNKTTLVCAQRHFDEASKLAPDWCGLIVAETGPRGAIRFLSRRRGRINPELDPVQHAHLLWHAEAAALLARFGASPKELRRPRKAIYEDLASHMSIQELSAAICEAMLRRQTWRDHPKRA